eukprot:1175817-Lingulodinium_polyedra.AAC.1
MVSVRGPGSIRRPRSYGSRPCGGGLLRAPCRLTRPRCTEPGGRLLKVARCLAPCCIWRPRAAAFPRCSTSIPCPRGRIRVPWGDVVACL